MENIIDWSNPESQISVNFKVKEALLLPSWNILHVPSEEEKSNIIKAAQMMEIIREYLGNPIHINCWIRPQITNCPGSKSNGKDYNKFVGGARNSAHIEGLACDFTVSRMTCDDVRHTLEPKLEEFKIRMENKPGSGWIHCDSRDLLPGGRRFFIP